MPISSPSSSTLSGLQATWQPSEWGSGYSSLPPSLLLVFLVFVTASLSLSLSLTHTDTVTRMERQTLFFCSLAPQSSLALQKKKKLLIISLINLVIFYFLCLFSISNHFLLGFENVLLTHKLSFRFKQSSLLRHVICLYFQIPFPLPQKLQKTNF